MQKQMFGTWFREQIILMSSLLYSGALNSNQWREIKDHVNDFGTSRLSGLVSGSRAMVTRMAETAPSLLSPFNFPIHFLHIVRRSEFCSGLIHHLMRATKSQLKSFPNNTFWRLRMWNIFPLSLYSVVIYSFTHLWSNSVPPLSLNVFQGKEKKRFWIIITLWFDMILTNAFHLYSMQPLAPYSKAGKEYFKQRRDTKEAAEFDISFEEIHRYKCWCNFLSQHDQRLCLVRLI